MANIASMNKPIACRVVGVWVATSLVCAAQADWARFRGPDGTGIGPAPEVPSVLTEKNLRWNTALPGSGHASPVLWGSHIFTACQIVGKTPLHHLSQRGFRQNPLDDLAAMR